MMKATMKTLPALLLALTLGGCAIGGGKPPVVTPPQPPPADVLVEVPFQVHDFHTPADLIQDAIVTCHEAAGSTDGFGRVWLHLANRAQECLVHKDGYGTTVRGLVPGTENPVGVSLTRLAAPVPDVPVSRNARQGQLHLRGDGFHDATGPVNPLWEHAGNLLAIFVRDASRALGELNDVATAGYQGIRVWGTLGCGAATAGGCPPGSFWRGHEVGPDVTPAYWDQVAAFADALRARGLRAVWSQGDVGQIDRRDYMRRLAAVDQERPFIDVIDCGNEAWQTGEPDARKLAECVSHYQNAGGRALLTLTSPPGEGKDELDAYSIAPAQLFDVHSYRGGHSWDKRRHIFSIPYEGKPAKQYGIGSEPPGNGPRVSVTDNKHELDDEAVPTLAVASMYSRQGFVHFSSDGVIVDGGLKTGAGFWTTPTAVDWLPKDVMGFTTLHHGGDTWRGWRVLKAQGETRVDCRTHVDGRFACTIDGPAVLGQQLEVERSFTGRLCDPGTGHCEDVQRSAGQTLPVSFARGRVFVGRAQ
jgi:hypothetical protein